MKKRAQLLRLRPFLLKKDLHYFAAKVIFALTNHLEWTHHLLLPVCEPANNR